MPTSRSSDSGFTLLEVLVALAIMGLVLVVSLPLLSGPRAGLEVRAAGTSLARVAREARQLAIRLNRPVPVYLDVTTRQLSIDGGEAVTLGSSELEIAFTTARSLTFIGELENGQAGTVIFFPDGSSSGGLVTLTRDGASRSFEINWITGALRQIGDEHVNAS